VLPSELQRCCPHGLGGYTSIIAAEGRVAMKIQLRGAILITQTGMGLWGKELCKGKRTEDQLGLERSATFGANIAPAQGQYHSRSMLTTWMMSVFGSRIPRSFTFSPTKPRGNPWLSR